MSRRALLAGLALSAALGCSAVDRLLDNSPKPSAESGAFAEQRDRWTRRASLYDGLTMRVLATATYEVPELRRARAERTAEWKAMTAPERDALVAAEDADAARFEDFVVSMTTSDIDDNDLDSKKTDWRIALVAPGAPDVVGAQVTQLRIDALLRTLYPQITDFDLVYRVRFPRPATAPSRPWTLRLAGPRGRVDFDFWLPPGAQRPEGEATTTDAR